ncbi:MAG TPA: DUF418 domain-containing protein [Sphingomicrobium sp.]|nr:DUF418 domain-containing protein [Sphingomicrobium sp.]
MTAAKAKRFATLDIVRGVAVMGILAMNIVGFAMPDQAYLNPRAYGTEGPIDLASWAFNFVFIDGKMRGLFSFLFGASMLLVIERARANGESEARVHFSRMLWLLLFGYLHFYFIWYGDILTGYATLGMVAWFFRDQSERTLVKWAAILIGVQFVLFAFFALSFAQASAAATTPGATSETVKQWAEMSEAFSIPSSTELARSLAIYRGDWLGLSLDKLSNRTTEPLFMLSMFGWETLAYLLLGMALLKNGFFAGQWDDARYRRAMTRGFGIAIPAYILIAAMVWLSDFAVPQMMLAMAATVLFRPIMVVAIAALIILATRRGGRLVERIAATGRAAFTNYLGTSLIMTSLFYGYGLGWFGTLSRAELWLVVLPMWALMLAWSKPWLDRFQYGPFEWLWRSLARWQPQPMIRRGIPAEA